MHRLALAKLASKKQQGDIVYWQFGPSPRQLASQLQRALLRAQELPIVNLAGDPNPCSSISANKDSTIGIGSGQPSRLDSCNIAISKMKQFHKDDFNDEIIAASDAFFPFVDGIESLVQVGVRAIIQPSGSIRDKEIIKFANQTDTILVFSKTRHFRH